MDKRIYTVEKILDGIVTLEDRETGFMIDHDITDFPFPLHEGAIISYKDEYVLENDLEQAKREDLRSRLERLKALKND